MRISVALVATAGTLVAGLSTCGSHQAPPAKTTPPPSAVSLAPPPDVPPALTGDFCKNFPNKQAQALCLAYLPHAVTANNVTTIDGAVPARAAFYSLVASSSSRANAAKQELDRWYDAPAQVEVRRAFNSSRAWKDFANQGLPDTTHVQVVLGRVAQIDKIDVEQSQLFTVEYWRVVLCDLHFQASPQACAGPITLYEEKAKPRVVSFEQRNGQWVVQSLV
jgi:hypothetical protein